MLVGVQIIQKISPSMFMTMVGVGIIGVGTPDGVGTMDGMEMDGVGTVSYTHLIYSFLE